MGQKCWVLYINACRRDGLKVSRTEINKRLPKRVKKGAMYNSNEINGLLQMLMMITVTLF